MIKYRTCPVCGESSSDKPHFVDEVRRILETLSAERGIPYPALYQRTSMSRLNIDGLIDLLNLLTWDRKTAGHEARVNRWSLQTNDSKRHT